MAVVNDAEIEFDEARRTLGLEVAVEKLPNAAARQLSEEVRRRFVDSDPSAWWDGFKNPDLRRPYANREESKVILRSLLPAGCDPILLFLESDASHAPVYRGNLAHLLQVIDDCSAFEYYLAPPDLGWIIADTEHEQLIRARPSPAAPA